MNKSQLVMNGVLIAAVLALFVKVYSGDKANNKVAATTTHESGAPSADAMQTVDAPIAYINTDSLWNKLDMVKDMNKTLEQEKVTYENQFKARATAFQTEVRNFEAKAPSMSQFEGQTKQQELMKQEQELYDYQDQLSEKLAISEQKKSEEFNKTLKAFLKSHNEEKQYKYILAYSQVGSVLMADSTLEITGQVVELMNAEYNAQKATKK